MLSVHLLIYSQLVFCFHGLLHALARAFDWAKTHANEFPSRRKHQVISYFIRAWVIVVITWFMIPYTTIVNIARSISASSLADVLHCVPSCVVHMLFPGLYDVLCV